MNVSTNDPEMFKLTRSLNYTYSQRLCYDVSIQIKVVIIKCGCNHPSLPVITRINDLICTSVADLICGEDAISNAEIELFEKDCPIQCDTTDYLLNTNSAYYPTEYYSSILLNQSYIVKKFNGSSQSFNILKDLNATNRYNSTLFNFTSSNFSSNIVKHSTYTLTHSDLAKSCLKVSIFYHDLSYTFIEENASVTIDTLIGTIGIILFYF